ncbi:MAG: Uncharacterised protein [Hyphomonas sp. TMED17]|nr:MAG: Uncharacterised protein [Hyphomonas sp. TMED17]
MNIHTGLISRLKQAHQISRSGQEQLILIDTHPPADYAKITARQGLFAICPQEPTQSSWFRFLLRLELCRKNTGQTANILGSNKVSLHETLDTKLPGPVEISHPVGELGLEVKTQTFFRSTCQKVQMTAHSP